MALQIRPTGTVVEGRTDVADDYWGGIESVIHLDASEFPLDSLQGLEEFPHLVVVWHFNQASPPDIEYNARSPRRSTAWPATGTFARRNHRRPKQLAQSFPRLLKVDYDLPPYFKQMGPRGSQHQPVWPGEMLADYWTAKA
ncbi:TrmO family methyltransferase domain-containing protein [Streptomyces fractus]|uniref:TrmO family methyltransferase domain-containing protein n=1 Tax=Streptomyces fractus TaxID=641806 RepID=UPI003CEF54A6